MGLVKDISRKVPFFSSREQDLQKTFKSNYYSFKLLLYANRKALEAMTEMESALRGTEPFGFHAVRMWCTQASTNVLQIINSLDQLAPGKYKKLYDRFDEIRKQISKYMHPVTLSRGQEPILAFEDIDKTRVDDVGSKMAFLGEMKRNPIGDVRIPEGFVITVEAYNQFMEFNDLQTEINRCIQAADSHRIDELYRLSAHIQLLVSMTAKMPKKLEIAIFRHYDHLKRKTSREVNVAVRSSAYSEDVKGLSFAGQYRSELNVRPENISQAYKNVVASKYSLQAMNYRFNRGLRDEDIPMSVGCMAMIDAVSGGVAYSRNPVNIRDDSLIVHSAWGLPKSVVNGTGPADRFGISRETVLSIKWRDISLKQQECVPCWPEGVAYRDLPPEACRSSSLTDEQVLNIAQLALDLESRAGTPQDVEWALDRSGSLVLLQSRPLQLVAGRKRGGELHQPGGRPYPLLLDAGVTASPGVAAGISFFVDNDADAIQFPEGAVLVVRHSLPRWAALLNSASAVVAEKGTTVGHLATVAREFGVPALFGVEQAVKILKDGRLITVDADAHAVYEGAIDDLLEPREEKQPLMENSPVMETLKALAPYIIPLHLIDPESPKFAPENCETLHDITRFCHEKVLEEMFRFANERRLAGRSSKQLKCDLPMTYWLLNLDDGFKRDVEGNLVELEDVASIPMLAFWRGMLATPWEGPPAVPGRGLMSVFLQATMNPKLEPGLRSPYATRNYCLIAKHFCILQLRFNFHFCTLESLVGEADMNNYIIYHFKGGAADLKRRSYRSRMVSEVLERYGFRTTYREDAAFARLEGNDQSFVENRLEILGFVTAHTRQLDMAMTDENAFLHYKEKILKGTEKVAET